MNLSEYLELLEEDDQLCHVSTAVSCDLEVAALSRLEFNKPGGGKALLFGRLYESDMALAANLFGSQVRLLKMLRCASMEQLGKRFRELLQHKPAVSSTSRSVEGSSSGLEVDSSIKLTELPGIRSWPGEKGSYLTLPLTVTVGPECGSQNVGLYRAEILNDTQIALNFATGSGADRHLQAAKRLNRVLPVALVLGGDPAHLYSAAAPLPEGWSEFDFSAAAFNTDNRLVRCCSQDLMIPADAELVIEGYIEPGLSCTEGPFGNHTGRYVTRSDCPLLQVTAVAKRPNPIIPVTVVGPPPSENIFLGKTNEVLLREMLQLKYPQIADLLMPLETIFHGVSLLSIRSPKQNMNRELIDDLWHNSPLSRAKLLILLDEDVELANLSQCWWRTINQLDGKKLYQDKGRLAIDATGIDLSALVKEDQQTLERVKQITEFDF